LNRYNGFLLLMLALSVLGCATNRASGRDEATKTTICSIVSAPERFDNRLVSINAFFESDGIEHTVLIDRACPDQGIAPFVPTERDNNADIRKLDEALAVGRPGTLDKEISGTFIGTFSWRPGQIPARALSIMSISNLELKRKELPR